MKQIALAAVSALTLAAALPTHAAITAVAYDVTGHSLIDFEDQPASPFPGVVYNGVLSSGGAQFAERFVGQTLSFAGDNDVLSGTPTGPLTLQVGLAQQNLDLGTDDGTHNLIPCGQLGCSDGNGYGEGSWAVKFASPTAYFGFQGLFADSGGLETTVDFFDGSGGLLQEFQVAGNGSFGFLSSGANIAGVSVFTSDPGGLGYDNVLYDGTSTSSGTPESAAWMLLIGGFGLTGASLRRRRLAHALA